MNVCIRNKGLITGNIRNRGNDEWSKRSNCSVHQGIKVGSAKEHNQYTLIPQRVNQQVNALSPSYTISLKEVGLSPADLNIPQRSIRTFLTSIPGSLNIPWRKYKIVPRRNTRHPSGISLPSTVQKFPQESWINLPSRVLEAYPQQILEAYPLRARTHLPGFIQRLFPTRAYNWVILSPRAYNWVILSQLPRKDRPRRSSSYPPAEFINSLYKAYQRYPQRSYHQTSGKYLSPHRALPAE